MPVPTYDQFIDPILRYLAGKPEGSSARDAHEAAADALHLTEADREEVLPSGAQATYKNRAGWAHDRLKRNGLSSSPRRGFWKLTEAGKAFVATHPGPLSAAEVEALASSNLLTVLNPTRREAATSAEPIVPAPDPPHRATPDERLEEAIREIRQAVSRDLLEALHQVTPSFFERIVLEVLHQMGYGASREDLVRVGGSGDGGIDGTISLDRLGLEKVYVQAKRWQGSVGRPEVQGFYGALAGLRARKGVFITTSTFTHQAVEFARSVEGIVLVDGVRLAQFMMDYGVGASVRTLQIPHIDRDFFEEE